MTIKFTTRDYEAAHGRRPRGTGIWWFDIEGNEFQAFGTLTEAKKECRKHIREKANKSQCTIYVAVLP